MSSPTSSAVLDRLRSYLRLCGSIWQAPGNQGHQLQALARSILWLLNKKTLRRRWTLPSWPGQRFYCHPGSVIADHFIHHSPWFDAAVSRFLEEWLRPGDTFWDIGANIGLYTLQAARLVGAGGSVHAVEPSPVNRAWLEENLTLNGGPRQVRLHPCALGCAQGQMTFCDEDALAHLSPDGNGTVEVSVQCLDTLAGTSELGLVKLDVEGYELPVLQGATLALREDRLPVLLFEMNHSLRRYGFEARDLFAFLESHGFRIGQYDPVTRSVCHVGTLEGDLLACTSRGRALLENRMGIRF